MLRERWPGVVAAARAASRRGSAGSAFDGVHATASARPLARRRPGASSRPARASGGAGLSLVRSSVRSRPPWSEASASTASSWPVTPWLRNSRPVSGGLGNPAAHGGRRFVSLCASAWHGASDRPCSNIGVRQSLDASSSSASSSRGVDDGLDVGSLTFRRGFRLGFRAEEGGIDRINGFRRRNAVGRHHVRTVLNRRGPRANGGAGRPSGAACRSSCARAVQLWG